MENLSELISVANAASSARTQTERKAKVDRIHQLLNQTPVIKALDKNSSTKANSPRSAQQLFAWDNLFTLTKNILEIETEAQKKLKDSVSATTASNREKKKRDLLTLVKNVVKMADKRGQKNLRAGEVVEFVLSSLADDYSCASFGVDLSTMLVKDILAVRRYWADLPTKTWLELLTVYCKLLQAPPHGFDRFVLARVIHVVSNGASQQCDIRGKVLLPILTSYFHNIREENRMKVKEEMVATLLVVSRSLAVNGRNQVCGLGEQLIVPLLYLWSHRPSQLLKDRLIEFLHLQLMAHHPRGASSEDTGAFAVDWDSWKSDMKKIYEAVYNDLQEWTGRTKFSTSSFGSRESVRMKENYVNFTVHLCHQLFLERRSVLDVTQVATQHGAAPKRRRIESGWGMLGDAIAHHEKGLAIPWLQILQGLLKQYPESLPEEEVYKLLTTIHTLQTDTKHADTLALSLATLSAIAKSHDRNRTVWSTLTLSQCNSVWSKVWAATIRCLSLHQAENEGYLLLSQLLSLGIIVPDHSLWMLFLPHLSPVTQSAVDFLGTFLSQCDIPDRYRPSVMVAMDTDREPDGNYRLRYQLIDWLFPANRDYEEEEEEGSHSHKPSCDIHQVSPTTLAELAVSLTLRDSRSIDVSSNTGNQPCPTAGSLYEQDIEQLYLQLTFDLALQLEEREEKKVKVSESGSRSPGGHLASVYKYLLDVVERETERLLATCAKNYEVAERAFWWCEFLSSFLASLLNHSLITENQVCTHPIINNIKNTFKQGTSAFLDNQTRDQKASPELALTALLHLLQGQGHAAKGHGSTLGQNTTSQGHPSSQNHHPGHNHHYEGSTLAQCLVPTRLVDHLRRMIKPGNSGTMPEFNRSDDDLFGSGDEMDISVNRNTSQAMDLDDDFDIEAGCGSNTQEEAEGSNTLESNSCESLLSPSLLTDSQRHLLIVLRILSQWSRQDVHNVTLGLTSDLDPASVMDDLLLLLGEQKGWDPHKPFCLQQLQVLAEEFCSPSSIIRGTDCETISAALWEVGKSHRRDQDICSLVLMLVSRLVPHLAKTPKNTNIHEAQRTCLHLVSVFRKLSADIQYSYRTRVSIAACMAGLLKADPNGEWELVQGRGDTHSHQEEFPKLLKDKNPAIRLLATANIQSLFVTEGKTGLCPRRREKQDAMFDNIYIIISKIMTVEGRLSQEEELDESANRTASLLHTLAAMTTASAICEKKSLFAFYQVTHENNINKALTIKVLEQVASRLNYSDLKEFSATHLPFLLTQWLDSDYTFDEFPYQLTGFKSISDFYANHYKVLVPVLLMKQSHQGLATVAGQLHVNETSLLKRCLPRVLVLILPKFAMATKAPSQVDRDAQRGHHLATKVYDTVVQAISKEAVEECIVNKLAEIVVQILMCLYTPNKHADNNNMTVLEAPEPNPPCYSRKVISATMEFLVTNHSSSAASIVALLTKTQDGIQRVLLSLHQAMAGTHRVYEKRRILYMYQVFVRLLLDEFQTGLGGNSAFVLRDVIYTLLYTLEGTVENDGRRDVSGMVEDLACSCLELLQDVLTTSIQNSYNEVGRFLPFISSTLFAYSDSDAKVGKKCLSLLEFLMVEHKTELCEFIRLLPPPPDTARLHHLHMAHQDIKYQHGPLSLSQEVEHFLSGRASCQGATRGSVEALRFLHQELEKRKEELKEIVQDSRGQNFADSGAPTLLVRLLSELLALLSCKDEKVAMESSRVLGEIGPVELDVVAMAPRPRQQELEAALEKYTGNAKAQQYCHILHMLDQYLTDSSVPVVAAASSVLKKILSTKPGLDFYADYSKQMEDALRYLHPFKAPKRKKPVNEDVDLLTDGKLVNEDAETLLDGVITPTVENRTDQAFIDLLDNEELWSPSNSNHGAWLVALVHAIIASGALPDPVLLLVAPICDVKVEMCEVVLPFLLHDVLLHGADVHKDVLSRQIQAFFSKHCHLAEDLDSRNSSVTTSGGEVCQNIKSVRIMLNAVQYLRLQERPGHGKQVHTAWDKNWWLELDYLTLAQAAANCSSYFTTLLFAEIWCNTQRKSGAEVSDSPTSSSQSMTGDILTDLTPGGSVPNQHPDINIQELMLEAYRNLGDQDGVYGCGAGKLADQKSRIQTYEHENKWSKAVGSYDIHLSLGSNFGDQVGILQALQKFGAGHVLENYLQGLGTDEQSLREFQYEAAWRNGTWEQSTPTRFGDKVGFHESLYSSLNAVRHHDVSMMTSPLEHARHMTVTRASAGSLKIMSCVYPMVARLHCLNQLEHASTLIESDEESLLLHLENLWVVQDPLLHQDFDILEEPLLQRCRLLQAMRQRQEAAPGDVVRVLSEQLVQFARQARVAGRHQVAERALSELRHVTSDDEQHKVLPWKLEEAQLYWCRGETDTAKHLVKSMLKSLSKQKEASSLYPQCLGIHGNWLAATKSENPNTILEDYLIPAVESIQSQGLMDASSLDAYLSLARYTDAQYQQIVDYMNSPTFEAKQTLMKQAKEDAEGLRKLGESRSSRYLRTLDLQSKIDETELLTMKSDRDKYLMIALKNYVKCLQAGDSHNLRIFRLTALWFSNKEDQQVNKIIKKASNRIKSYKFLPLMYQLAARMSCGSGSADMFLSTLEHVIERTVRDHPHHCLSVILALAHAHKDEEFLTSSRRGGKLSKSGKDTVQDQDRVKAAKAMIARLKATARAEMVTDMEALSTAYIELANLNVDQFKRETKPIKFPSSVTLAKVSQLSSVAVPTADIKVDPACEYKDIVYVTRFEKTFKLAGGINLPKIITCIGSDGIPRRQLVKGKDDLRQDAVMQQVFGMVNHLLQQDKKIQARKLRIRQYKVIPLSQRSGLLEWCEGTIPFGEYLIGGKGAHQRYRPKDNTAAICRNKLAGANRDGKDRRYEVYAEICKDFQPVFRHFFMEKFPDPTSWYERRTAYTRSVATNSIVGYILGLGDRHVQNILIDCNTAELIHIDLGVAFEQGKILPTPETIPFRLTRDVVDGMGVTGVEGTFRRCCESTMEMLRGSGEALLTILTVLLYDPLYAWTISPLKAYALQARRENRSDTESNPDANTTANDILALAERSSSPTAAANPGETVNQLAERVLLRLKQKLDGVEQNVHLSVSGHVNLLIQQATDPHNLCKLFPGWQPYM